MRTPVRSLAAWFCAAALSATLLTTHAHGATAGFPCVPGPGTLIGFSITLGGLANGVVDFLATKTVTILDCLNEPYVSGVVMIDFRSCADQDIRLCDTQPDHPGALFDCAQKRVMAVTNTEGVATFRIAGGATNAGGNLPGAGTGCARIFIDGLSLGSLTVSAADQNGIGGVTVADLSSFGSDRFGAYRGRSDFNGDHAVNVADLAIFGQFRFGGGSIASCASVCP